MIHFIPSILTKDECKYLTEQFDIERRYKNSTDNEYSGTNISYGFTPSFVFNTYLNKLKSKVLEYNNNFDELLNVNAFVREYVNTSTLKKHLDRKDISVTMSICLESTINSEWPLCAEIENKEYCFNTNVGDGILLFDADKIIHWRDPLQCQDKERVVQFFLHWSPTNYISKKTKSLL
ncbi:MAG: hypothetical protein RLZ10_2880 [Bacteroidota bacterium]|jgi:hypothetical protein